MSDPIVEVVRSKYASIAQGGLSGQHEGVRGVAEAFGYSREQLDSIPAEANMGLSCGNPTAFASLRPGEVEGRAPWTPRIVVAVQRERVRRQCEDFRGKAALSWGEEKKKGWS